MTAALATFFLINTALKHQGIVDEIAQHEQPYSGRDSIKFCVNVYTETRDQSSYGHGKPKNIRQF